MRAHVVTVSEIDGQGGFTVTYWRRIPFTKRYRAVKRLYVERSRHGR